MNKLRRTEIANLADQLGSVQAGIEEIGGEERDYFDSMPESLQGSEKGIAAEEAADELDNIAGEIEDIVARLSDIAAA